MGGRIVQFAGAVACLRHNLPSWIDDNCAHRHLAACTSGGRFGQGGLHVGSKHHPFSCPQLPPFRNPHKQGKRAA
jgi:hypothetical protein